MTSKEAKYYGGVEIAKVTNSGNGVSWLLPRCWWQAQNPVLWISKSLSASAV